MGVVLDMLCMMSYIHTYNSTVATANEFAIC